MLRQRNSEPWWRCTTTTLMGVSFETYRRRCRDVLMGRRGYAPLRRFGYIPMRRRWVFHLRLSWDVVETYHWDVLATFHRDVVGCFIWDVNANSLGRTERRRYDVATASCCRVGIHSYLVRIEKLKELSVRYVEQLILQQED